MNPLSFGYHWSPTERRRDILQQGLILYANTVTHTPGHGQAPYLCFGLTPSSAWGLSGDMEWTSEIDKWDLWQVAFSSNDQLQLLVDFGPKIREVRCRNSIAPDRLFYVGTREPMVFETGERRNKCNNSNNNS